MSASSNLHASRHTGSLMPDLARTAKARPSLRNRQSDLTRDLITNAFRSLLVDDFPEAITYPQVAEAAGVSLRTVYRYFPARADLLSAAWEWWDELTHEIDLTDPATVTDLGRLHPEIAQIFDEHTNLFRALSLAGNRIESRRSTASEAVEAVSDLLPADQVKGASAIVGYIRSGPTWLTLHDEFGLSGDEVLRALDWAAGVLIEDLRRQNELARRELERPTDGSSVRAATEPV